MSFKNKIKLKPALLKNPVHFLALGFGSGLSPWAPGTMGTLATIPLFYFLSQTSLEIYLLCTVLITLAGIYLCGKSAELIGVHDHSGIVWDEIAGYLITMIAVPFEWRWVLVGFVLFRLFDIVKPWPIKWLDKKVEGGFGIMIDDVIAGVFAAICLQLIMFYWK